MASIVYTSFKGKLLDSTIDLDADSFRVILLNSTYNTTSGVSAHSTYNHVSAFEVSGTGYTVSAGQVLSGTAVYTIQSTKIAVWSAANVTWPSSTITANYATIYDASSSNYLVATIDFGGSKSSSNGDFTVQWNANGILNLTD